MSRPIVRIHNLETNDIIDREMNDEEFAQYQLDQSRAESEKQSEEEKALAKSSLLERLGITEEEAKLLLS
jgi:hypothetical protein